jgi:hypothetical protein
MGLCGMTPLITSTLMGDSRAQSAGLAANGTKGGISVLERKARNRRAFRFVRGTFKKTVRAIAWLGLPTR